MTGKTKKKKGQQGRMAHARSHKTCGRKKPPSDNSEVSIITEKKQGASDNGTPCSQGGSSSNRSTTEKEAVTSPSSHDSRGTYFRTFKLTHVVFKFTNKSIRSILIYHVIHIAARDL